MSAKNSLLFKLLRNALGIGNDETLPLRLSEKQAERILALAERQAVTGLIANALLCNKVELSEDAYYDMVGLFFQIEERNKQIDEGLRALASLLDKRNVDYFVVKGQVVGSYYPNPAVRISGDIDYYCNAKNFSLSQSTIEQEWGKKCDRRASKKHIHFRYEDITYEGHFILADLYNKKRNSYFQNLLDGDKGTTVRIGDYPVKTLSPTLHVLYVFIHLYHHLLALGVGLRQFCDMAVMLHYSKDDIDMDVLCEHLQTLGMVRAYRACGSILVDYLGLPEKELGYTLSDSDRRYGMRVLDVVNYRGNMGHSNKRNGLRGWKHKVESATIKLSHFVKFAPLAPDYSCCWMWDEIRRVFNNRHK